MNVELVEGRNLSEEHVEAWRATRRAHASLSHPLLHPRWTQLVALVDPRVEVAVLRRHGCWIGCWPFTRTGPRSGRAVATDMSDLHGVIAPPETELDPVELLSVMGLSSWSFDHLPADQPWFREHAHQWDHAALVHLDGGAGAWWESVVAEHSSWCRQLERKGRKLSRELGTLRFVWHETDHRLLERLVQWKRWRLAKSGFRDVFQRAWLRKLLEHLLAQPTGDFTAVHSVLYAGSEPVACHLGLRSGDMFVSWIPAYAPELARCSPGALLHRELVERAAAEGVRTIDLGSGLNPLKRALANDWMPLAIGTVDCRPVRRWVRARWKRLRHNLTRTPVVARMLPACRRTLHWWHRPSET